MGKTKIPTGMETSFGVAAAMEINVAGRDWTAEGMEKLWLVKAAEIR